MTVIIRGERKSNAVEKQKVNKMAEVEVLINHKIKETGEHLSLPQWLYR